VKWSRRGTTKSGLDILLNFSTSINRIPARKIVEVDAFAPRAIRNLSDHHVFVRFNRGEWQWVR
jgi:hypothetical protein